MFARRFRLIGPLILLALSIASCSKTRVMQVAPTGISDLQIDSLQLLTHLKGDELKTHWETLLKYANDLKKDMNMHYDKDKVDELSSMLKNVSVKSDGEDQNCNNPSPSNTLDK